MTEILSLYEIAFADFMKSVVGNGSMINGSRREARPNGGQSGAISIKSKFE